MGLLDIHEEKKLSEEFIMNHKILRFSQGTPLSHEKYKFFYSSFKTFGHVIGPETNKQNVGTINVYFKLFEEKNLGIVELYWTPYPYAGYLSIVKRGVERITSLMDDILPKYQNLCIEDELGYETFIQALQLELQSNNIEIVYPKL
jgi:hypothetical protein